MNKETLYYLLDLVNREYSSAVHSTVGVSNTGRSPSYVLKVMTTLREEYDNASDA